MKVVQKNITEITPYENNPRLNDGATGLGCIALNLERERTDREASWTDMETQK